MVDVTGPGTSRDLLGQLIQARVLGSSTEKGPVSLRFPADALDILFPTLFPEA